MLAQRRDVLKAQNLTALLIRLDFGRTVPNNWCVTATVSLAIASYRNE